MDENIQQLIIKCRKNDRQSQFKLFELYLPYTTSICKRYLRQHSLLKDVVQEVFIIVFKSLKSNYQEEKGPFKAWLRKIAINCSLKYNAKYKGFEVLDMVPSLIDIPDEKINQLSDLDLLKVIRSIPEANRDVFNLYVIDGFTHKEIAQILEISEQSSRKKLERARSFLKKTFRFKGLLLVDWLS